METANINNVAKAVELLCQAADQDYAPASYLLGKMIVAGQIVCVGAKAREIRRLALKPFNKRHPRMAEKTSRSILFAVYRPHGCGRAQPHPGRPACERYTGNPIHHYDRWTDNQCF